MPSTRPRWKVADKGVAMSYELACCVQVIDAGTKNTVNFGDQINDRQIFIGWEILVDQGISSDSRNVYKSYDVKWSETSELRKDVKNWLGAELTDERIKRFTPKSLLGKYCNLELVPLSNDDGAKILAVKGVAPLPIGIDPATLTKPVSSFRIFTISEPDMELLESLPVEIKNQIKNSPEYAWAQKVSDDDYE